MRILLLSHTGLSSVFRVGSHHLARELSAAGHDVVHISNPISVSHLAAVRDPEVRRRARQAVPLRLRMADGAAFAVPWSLFPLMPDPLPRPVRLGSGSVLRRRLADHWRALGSDPDRPFDLTLIDQPLLDYLLDDLPVGPVVYRPTDVNVRPAQIAAEERVLGRCQGVVATSAVVAAAITDRLAAQGRTLPVTAVPNGAQIAVFEVDGPSWDERRGAVYVGALDERFDWAAVREMALAEPDEPVDVFGPVTGPVPALPGNVAVRGPVPYERVPGLFATHRVGILPLSDHPTNAGRSPMKLYEYLAAGLRVVSRRTPALAAAPLADVSLYGTTVSRPATPAAGTGAPAEAGPTAGAAYRAAHSAPPAGDGRAAAREMDWSVRAALVLDRAREMTDPAGDSTLEIPTRPAVPYPR